MIIQVKTFVIQLRSFLSRSEWAIRLLRLSRLKESAQKPGLVMIQIDGLSQTQFQKAISDGHLPFLNSLLQKERYALHTFYSGVPSNTPSVQGELFYGIKTCVPAFSFVDNKTGQPIKMNDTAYVSSVEADLKTQGQGLLSGGSSYSNIFAGGAEEAHFCWGNMGWKGFLHAVNPLVFPFLVILYIDIFIRTVLLLTVELVISIFDCIRGTLKGRVFLRELELIWLRALICVFLREFITAGASIDIIRGLPVIHLNLLGYDEQAHCRGPSSKFAHWSLLGVDDAIRRIDRVIKKSAYREYDLWVYSDHGQEKTAPYLIKYGMTIDQAIEKIFKEPKAIVAAMGPVGHIYVQRDLAKNQIEFFARKLVEEAHIPLVIVPLGNHKALAWTKRGAFMLPEQSKDVFGEDHPFLGEVTEDVLRVCHHSDAGDFIILGWCKDEAAISFPLEYGAHAGAGPEETKGFALLPMDVDIESNGKNYIRPMDLRKAAQNFLSEKSFYRISKSPQSVDSKSLRMMSYNVHGCKGMDGRISTDRIIRVIARYKPDVVALQELDSGRLRSFGIDQAQRIAQRLGMFLQFHPAFSKDDEQYGNAILSRYPMALIKKDVLPKLWDKAFLEFRGAIWVVVDFQGTKINIINTHLSLWPKERLLQIKALLDGNWVEHPDCSGPVILCGDLNMVPNSPVYKEICKRFKDSQLMVEGSKPTKTWLARYPLMRIDHIFVTPEFRVDSIEVFHTALERLASDHLPIIAELSFEQIELLAVNPIHKSSTVDADTKELFL
ncbi:MAG: endonuclease/exonuclease/phosphatase family protein [Candidatus Omnitrophica bacterium]|nr:endonuclease/exonuclease/phosphatase family protein [Candidatus Omnitrophota bacterium]